MIKALKQFLTIQHYESMLLKHYFKRDLARILVALAFLLVAAFTTIGIFFASQILFIFYRIQENPFEEIVFLDSLNLFTLFLLFLLTIGTIISTLSILFNHKKTQYLITMPISFQTIFISSFTRIFSLNLIGIILIALPVFLAFGKVWDLDQNYYLSVALILICLALISSSLGVIMVFISGFLLPRKSPKLMTFSAVILTLLTAYVLAKLVSPSSVYIAGTEAQKYFMLETSRRFSLLLPSTWSAEIIFSFAFSQNPILKQEYALLILTSVLFLFSVLVAGKNFFYNLWTKSQEGNPYYFINHSEKEFSTLSTKKVFPLFFKNKIGAIIEKDFILLFRSLREFSKSFFLILLFALYFLIIYLADKQNLGTDWTIKLLSFSSGAFGYLTATLALYFVFPAISIEGRSLWLIRSLPVSLKDFFLSKIILWILLVIPFASLSTYFTISSFAVSSKLLNWLVLLSVIQGLTIIVLSYSMGAAFPVFREHDAEMISTSIQGIFTTIVNLFYVGFISWQVWKISYIFMTQGLLDIFSILNTLLISLILIIAFLFLAYKRFPKVV